MGARAAGEADMASLRVSSPGPGMASTQAPLQDGLDQLDITELKRLAQTNMINGFGKWGEDRLVLELRKRGVTAAGECDGGKDRAAREGAGGRSADRASDDQDAETIHDLTQAKCSLCQDNLTASQQSPQVTAGCGHAICKQCMNDYKAIMDAKRLSDADAKRQEEMDQQVCGLLHGRCAHKTPVIGALPPREIKLVFYNGKKFNNSSLMPPGQPTAWLKEVLPSPPPPTLPPPAPACPRCSTSLFPCVFSHPIIGRWCL